MALYVVLHHRQDQNQPWPNAWLDDQLIEAIETTNEIGRLCNQARERAERVYVHRCGWQKSPPLICCSAEVKEVVRVNRSSVSVRFANPAAMSGDPPTVPAKGQSFYVA